MAIPVDFRGRALHAFGMKKRTCESTDGRFLEVLGGWWDKIGVDILTEAEFDAYLAANPRVGIVVLIDEGEESDG